MDNVILLNQIDVKCKSEEDKYPSIVSLKFKSNLPKTIVCKKISISVVAIKKLKNKFNFIKSNTYNYDIKKSNILPMAYNHIYQQDGHFASTGIMCLNLKSYLRYAILIFYSISILYTIFIILTIFFNLYIDYRMVKEINH